MIHRSESDAVIGQEKCTVQTLTCIDMGPINLFTSTHWQGQKFQETALKNDNLFKHGHNNS